MHGENGYLARIGHSPVEKEVIIDVNVSKRGMLIIARQISEKIFQ